MCKGSSHADDFPVMSGSLKLAGSEDAATSRKVPRLRAKLGCGNLNEPVRR